ncbi:hypothetical protein [Paractinoplanes toevensis]|uniref:Lipoprotein n=1 Tax=Paractinoplanes toevensis TaxID=571911 RepID=A0A919T6Y1_9ACTN|nr:hypothetical protein [Actinoplanes toevensis]GIM89827.1 hypothetical protein Ato02nite_016200 [Actinoplanes toevensis]
MTRRGLLLTLAAALAVAGCSTGPVPAPPAAVSTPANPAPEPNDEDGAGTAPSAPTAPGAVRAAVGYVTAWARPGLAHDPWYAAVRDLVVAQYARLLVDTDPATVPAASITGPARVLTSTTAVVVVAVPTDAGTVDVTVVNSGGRWLVATARPAQP